MSSRAIRLRFLFGSLRFQCELRLIVAQDGALTFRYLLTDLSAQERELEKHLFERKGRTGSFLIQLVCIGFCGLHRPNGNRPQSP